MSDDKHNYINIRENGVHGSRLVNMTLEFFRLEAAGGILLVLASALALIVANTSLYPYYYDFLHGIQFRIGFSGQGGDDFEIRKDLLHWINDGMMAIFFLLVGLEIKRELIAGELSNRAKATLPFLAAIGGMAVPAGIYYFINQSNPQGLPGWAIPCATDIAFALGVLSILGSRVPVALKILLTAIAIIDDLGAIVIIALFYTADIHTNALIFGIVPIIGLFMLNRFQVASRAPYILLGLVLWAAVLQSGVHATMAGVITALFIPLTVPNERRAPAQRLEHDLHPWVAFLILPVFGFANAGVPFEGMGFSSLLQPVTLGIIAGLVIGKQVGIFATMWLAIKTGFCQKPEGTTWVHLYGVSILCGIGFTMSLFIGGLAFQGDEMQASVRLGVLVGSLISAVSAYIIFVATSKKA